jgi:hypothetical protein
MYACCVCWCILEYSCVWDMRQYVSKTVPPVVWLKYSTIETVMGNVVTPIDRSIDGYGLYTIACSLPVCVDLHPFGLSPQTGHECKWCYGILQVVGEI